jgi:hypothetical protein
MKIKSLHAFHVHVGEATITRAVAELLEREVPGLTVTDVELGRQDGEQTACVRGQEAKLVDGTPVTEAEAGTATDPHETFHRAVTEAFGGAAEDGGVTLKDDPEDGITVRLMPLKPGQDPLPGVTIADVLNRMFGPRRTH